MKNLHKRYKRFEEWEKQPHQVAPLSEVQQSAKIGRYSFKNLLYLL